MRGGLRILFVSMEYPPETGGGGIGTYLISLAPALAAQGHEVHVLSCVAGQRHADYISQGVHIHRRDQRYVRGLGRLKAPFTSARLRTGLSAFLEFRRLKIAFDVIEYPDWGAEGWLLSIPRSAPLVAHLHTPLPLIQHYNRLPRNRDAAAASFLERLSVVRAHLIMSSSHLLVSALNEIGWLKGRSVDVIPYGIDWDRWRDLPAVTTAGPTVLYVGRLEPRKAPEVLAAAIRLLRADLPEARAVFVGRCGGCQEGTRYAEWVQGLATDASSGCTHVEEVPRDKLRDLFAGARVVAMPSRFDSYGMVALEAMAAGRPVVVSATTGAAEFVRQVGSGRVVPPGDAEALADSLRPFLRDPEYAHEVGLAGQSAVRKHLDPDRIAAARADAYRRARPVASKHA
jgi:glycogen(starch) synthase